MVPFFGRSNSGVRVEWCFSWVATRTLEFEVRGMTRIRAVQEWISQPETQAELIKDLVGPYDSLPVECQTSTYRSIALNRLTSRAEDLGCNEETYH